jgi:hypothetical protein
MRYKALYGLARLFILTAAVAHAAAGAGYVGEGASVKCHAKIGSQWSHSRHSKMAPESEVDSHFAENGGNP